MGTIKSMVVPENIRTSLYSLFYIPMNVMIALVRVGDASQAFQRIWILCLLGVGCFVATALFLIMRKEKEQEKKEEEEKKAQVDAEDETSDCEEEEEEKMNSNTAEQLAEEARFRRTKEKQVNMV
jgi:flagellar biosynthesis/type III secretory pathway M-ring protein FliF/YscJ